MLGYNLVINLLRQIPLSAPVDLAALLRHLFV